MITFMVMHGFSLLEVRKLYFDELFEYYADIFLHLENRGEAKAGTYDKLRGVARVDDTLNVLRKQVFKATNPNKK